MIGRRAIKHNQDNFRVLIVHRYYWPDIPPCASIIRSIAVHLQSDGYSIDVLSSQQSYRSESDTTVREKREVVDGVSIKRLRLRTEIGHAHRRVFNAIKLGMATLNQALWNRYDVILATSIPPVLGGFFGALAARLTKARFIYYCMDLHPEIGRVFGDFSNPRLFSLLQNIDNWTCRQASPVLVHSEDMCATLQGRSAGKELNVQIMNNFALPVDQTEYSNSCFDIGAHDNSLTIIYAGNVGRFQGLMTVVTAMGMISYHSGIQLVILGDGVAKQSLLNEVELSGANVKFLDFQPTAIAHGIIRQADIGLITLLPEVYKYAYPSKTMAYLKQGIPIVASVEKSSELATTMEKCGYGVAVPVGDASAMADLFVKLASDTKWRKVMKQAASESFERFFSAEVVLNRWSRVLETGFVESRAT